MVKFFLGDNEGTIPEIEINAIYSELMKQFPTDNAIPSAECGIKTVAEYICGHWWRESEQGRDILQAIVNNGFRYALQFNDRLIVIFTPCSITGEYTVYIY